MSDEETHIVRPHAAGTGGRERAFGGGQIVLLAALGGIAPFGTDIFLASIPDVARDLGTTAAAVQFTLTGFMAGLALGPLVFGPLSDRVGRYRLLVAGVAALLASSILCALAPTIGLLIAARIVQGFAGAVAMTLGRSLVADVASGAQAARIYSLLSTIMGISPILAPILGGVIQQWADWRVTFWVLAALGAALTVGVLALLRETLPPERREAGGFAATLRNTGRVVRERQFVSFALALAFTSGALFAYISASPFVIQDVLGYSPLAYSLIFAVNAGGLTAAAGLSAALAGRLGPLRLTRIGAATVLAGAALVVVAAATGDASAWILLPGMFLIPTGTGFLLGNGTALAAENIGYAAGTAMALIGFLQFGMSALVAPLVGLAGPDSVVPFAVIAGASGLLLALAVLAGSRTVRRPRADP